MNMRQQIVDSRIADTAASLSVSRSQAFMRLAHSLVVRSSIVAFDANDLVDGGQDKQIDLFTIAEDGDSAEVYLIQVKDAETFQSTIVTQIRNGLDWVFNKKLHDVELLDNARFKNRIQEYRALQRNIGPSNIAVSVFHVTNGLTSEISREYEQEAKSIRDQFDNGTLSRFSFEPFGADELVQRINEIERGQQKVNCRIPIRYDSNNPSLIKYHAENLKGVVCTTTATELAKIVNSDTNNSVFESNVRTFLGGRGSVNSEIRKTCVNKDSSQLFWFLNNGITIVCDRFDAVTEPDNAHIIVENLQIVNGCQTAKTVAQAANSNELLSDTRVLLRIYETQDTGLVDQIVRTTNNQNRISARDLWSNNEVQKDMERAFRTHGLLYERKPRQYDAKEGIDLTKVVPNELVAQSYLAVVLKRPSDARRRKYLVWGDLYESIFAGGATEPYVLAFLIHRYVVAQLNKPGYTDSDDAIARKLAANGAFHVSRILALQWRQTENWAQKDDSLARAIQQLQKSTHVLAIRFRNAFDELTRIVRSSATFKRDIDSALKSHELDEAISKALNKTIQSRTSATKPAPLNKKPKNR